MTAYTDAELEEVAGRVHDIECDHRCAPRPRDFNEARIILGAVAQSIAARAWAEGHNTRWEPDYSNGACDCFAHSEAECACGRWGAVTPAANPYAAGGTQ